MHFDDGCAVPVDGRDGGDGALRAGPGAVQAAAARYPEAFTEKLLIYLLFYNAKH